jgi:hypothetical protein
MAILALLLVLDAVGADWSFSRTTLSIVSRSTRRRGEGDNPWSVRGTYKLPPATETASPGVVSEVRFDGFGITLTSPSSETMLPGWRWLKDFLASDSHLSELVP